MKARYILFIFMLSGIFFAGCNTNEDELQTGGDIDITEKLPEGTFAVDIKNLTTTSTTHSIKIQWEKPENTGDLSFYTVEWKGTTKDGVYSQSVKKDITTLDISHLYNEEYRITVKCVSSELMYSEGISVSASPIFDTTAPQTVTEFSAQAFETSVLLNWINPADPDFENIKLEIFDMEQGSALDPILLSSDYDNWVIANLGKNHEYRFSLSTMDYLGNTSASVSVETKTVSFKETMLKKNPAWTIVMFSSEESSGEGDNNGRAEHAIDTDDETFWHSQWSGSGSTLPQSIVFDVHQEVLPKTLVSYKRKNNSNGPQKVRVEGSPDNAIWYDFGTFDIDGTSEQGQECMLTGTRTVRYFKYTVLNSANGFAMVRNIEISILTPR